MFLWQKSFLDENGLDLQVHKNEDNVCFLKGYQYHKILSYYDEQCVAFTKIIFLQDTDVPDFFPHGYLFHSTLVQAELLGHIDVTLKEM